MILGEGYFTARERFKRQDFSSKGLLHITLDRRLAAAGYAVRRLYPEKGKPWPPEPFAPVHILRVRLRGIKGHGAKVHHLVVMTEGGWLLDPAWESATMSDYQYVLDVAGVFKMENKREEK